MEQNNSKKKQPENPNCCGGNSASLHDNPSIGSSPPQIPPASPEPMVLHVGNAVKERRLDKYLHNRFSHFSRVALQRHISSGHIKVNGRTVKPSFRLSAADKIELSLPPPPPTHILAENIPIDVIYQNHDIIVINKQPDMIVHPARGNTHGTLVNALAFYSTTLSSGFGEFRPGIVHRLDRDTSGVIVAARNDVAQWKIARQFEQRTIKKTYLAIVHGTPELTADCIKAPLGIHPRIREKYAIRPQVGKEAITFYEVLESFRGYSLLLLKPKTGRTHQLRVHLSYIKHPIVADQMYGGKPVYPWQLSDSQPAQQSPVISRCALHAWKLEFKHPRTEKTVQFEAPLPPDMQTMLDMLRKYRRG